jgi:hypothetical protein
MSPCARPRVSNVVIALDSWVIHERTGREAFPMVMRSWRFLLLTNGINVMSGRERKHGMIYGDGDSCSRLKTSCSVRRGRSPASNETLAAIPSGVASRAE